MVRRGRQIACKYALGVIKTLGYKTLQVEAKRCGAPATSTVANLRRVLESHIKEHGTASESILPNAPPFCINYASVSPARTGEKQRG